MTIALEMTAAQLIDYFLMLLEAEPWDVAQAPDNHSWRWHGSFILEHAKSYLETGRIPMVSLRGITFRSTHDHDDTRFPAKHVVQES